MMRAPGARRQRGRQRPLPAAALLPILALSLAAFAAPVRAAVSLDPAFWETYVPYQQYSAATRRDLFALREGDLLETGAEIDGVELRIVGRRASYADLISARVVVDSVARERLQLKILPSELTAAQDPRPEGTRRQLSRGQAEALVALLEEVGFWDAPYRLGDDEESAAFAGACDEAGRWIIEAVRPGMYQLIARSECGGLDPAAAAIRDFLLDLADVPAN